MRGVGIFLMLVGFAHSNVPKFDISEERSLDGGPIVVVTFPDGYTDTLFLSRHYSNDEDRLARNDDCNFIGHLTNEPESCVAMTGCLGSDDVDFTIMSPHASGSTMFHWSKEGDVMLIEHPLSITDNLTRDIDDDEIIIPEIQQAAEHYCDKNTCVDLPATQLLKIRVVYDNSFKNGVPNKEKYINALWTHIQANFCHYTLTSKVKVERFGSLLHVNKVMTAADSPNIQEFKKDTEKEILNGAHLVAYLGYKPNVGFSGLAYVNTVCRSTGNSGKTSISRLGSGFGAHAQAGGLLAHEIGHNLGMKHDFDVIHGGTDCPKCTGTNANVCCTSTQNSQTSTNACNKQGVMSYNEPSQRGQWSECSVKDFKGTYNLRKTNWCLTATQDNFCGTETLCKKAAFKDGICDPQNNNRVCGYDGGDCCSSNAGWDSRCKEIGTPLKCRCLSGGSASENLAIGLENGGKDCWTGCKNKQGKCDYCGFDGYCCRKGFEAGNGCDGSFGGSNQHQCVLKPLVTDGCKDVASEIWKSKNMEPTYGNLCDNYVGAGKTKGCDDTWYWCDGKKCGEFCKKSCNKCEDECKDVASEIWKSKNMEPTYGNLCDNYVGSGKTKGCDDTWYWCDGKKCGEFCKKSCNKC